MAIKKRITAFLLAVLLSFSACAVDYLEVQALEWAGVTVAFDTALKFLLGLLGVTVATGVADSIDWEEQRENCIQFQQNQGNSAVAVSNWWADVIKGKLDTASDVWVSFKEWVISLKPSVNIPSDGIVSVNIDDLVHSLYDYSYVQGSIDPLNPFLLDYDVKYGFLTFNPSDPSIYTGFYLLLSDYLVSGYYQSTSNVNGYSLGVSGFPFIGVSFDHNNHTYSTRLHNTSFQFFVFRALYDDTPVNPTKSLIFNKDGFVNIYKTYDSYNLELLAILNDLETWDLSSVSDSSFVSETADISDIALAPDFATDLPFEGVIDIPWENVGDSAEAVEGAIDEAIEKVNDGTWTVSNYWQYVQNVTNIFAYDITNNELLPDNGDSSDDTADDKVEQNVNRNGFVLAGLERVFPFCIPFDIYAFVNLLVAPPVAPYIEFPIYNPVTDENDVIIIDFSVWEDQVIILRYIFDFLLIIGLLLLARSLIGAGGDG